MADGIGGFTATSSGREMGVIQRLVHGGPQMMIPLVLIYSAFGKLAVI